MKKRIKINIIIFLLAIPLAIVVFAILENPNFLSASVISLQEEQQMKENKRDLGYKNDGNVLDVYIDDKLSNLDYLTLSVIYDQDDISFDLDNLSVQTDYEILSHEQGNLLIQFKNFSTANFDYKNSLFELKFTGNNSAILVSEATGFMFSGIRKLLAIGSLNKNQTSHN